MVRPAWRHRGAERACRARQVERGDDVLLVECGVRASLRARTAWSEAEKSAARHDVTVRSAAKVKSCIAPGRPRLSEIDLKADDFWRNSRSGFSSLISRFGESESCRSAGRLRSSPAPKRSLDRIKKSHVGDRVSLQLSHWFRKPRNDGDLTGLAASLANTIAEHPLGHLLNGQRLALRGIRNPSKPGSRYHRGLRLFQPLEARCEPAVSNMMTVPRRLRMKPLKAFAVCKLSETVPHARCRQHRFPSLLVRHGVGKCPRFSSKLPIPLCPTLHSMMTFTTWIKSP